ncbi:MAG TPA: hypothetical protein VFL14_09995, partial [Xanthomonadales bacterium]|nr:hypothetical protein [Xanthomonadales bacterium]
MAMHRPTTTAARRATGGATVRWLAALALFLFSLAPSAAFAQGGPQCPVQVFSGNFQSGDPNDVVDLTVRQGFLGATQPPTETFTWVIRSGTARFANTGGAQT